MSNVELVARLKTGLGGLRHLIIHNPSTLSIANVGAELEQICQDLNSLKASQLVPCQQDLLEIQTLSESVQSLYRSAAGFYACAAAESIRNGSWQAASYAADGEWSQPSSVRIEMQG